MTNNTINNVPRELKPVLAMILNALDRDAADGKQARAEMAAELRALLSAPSPASVDGLNTDRNAAFKACPESGCDWGSFYLGWKARGEVERLERAEKNDSIAYKAVLERQDELRAELAATKAQGVVIPAELDRAFITGESCDGVYRVVIQSEKLKEMQAVHSWLTSLNAAPAAPAADATVRQATDGGRNQSYEGLFDGETEEQRASRLAAHRTQGVV